MFSNLIGQTLGKYELRAMLGAGGMGAVYRAYDHSLQREVAVKVINLGASNDELQARFIREARTAAALEHSHIVRVYDYGVERDINYIVMQNLTGGALSDRMKQAAEEGRSRASLPDVALIGVGHVLRGGSFTPRPYFARAVHRLNRALDQKLAYAGFRCTADANGESLDSPTNDSASDAESAQNQLPSFSQYTGTDADNIKDAFTRALQVGSLGTGNLIAAGLIERLNNTADCLGNVGAISGRVYTTLTPPVVGVLAVVNNDRLTTHFLQCMVDPGAEAQTDGHQELQLCTKSGSHTVNGISYSYSYAASDVSMCAAFDGWLATKN